MDNLLADVQAQLEEELYADAKKRQAEDNSKTYKRGAWSESKMGAAYTHSASNKFIDAVRTFTAGAKTGKRGRGVRAAEHLANTGLTPEQVAFIYTRALFNNLALSHKKAIKRATLCMRAGDRVHDEWRIQVFSNEKERRNLLKKLTKQFNKRTYPREWRKRTIMNYYHAEQLEWSGWDHKAKMEVGYALTILFRDATGLIVTSKEDMYVHASPVLLADFEANMQRLVMAYMVYKPMVVAPRPWTEEHLFRGGYLSRKVKRYPIVKGAGKRDVARFTEMDWSQVIPALNALQETPWRVNRKMLEMLDWSLMERGGGFAGLPLANPKPLPPEPFGYRVDEAVTKEHNKVCFLIHNENRELISKRLSVLSTLVIGKQYRNFKAIYFPHNLDSRGRAYPLPAFLNPQGPDYVKALLEFADGKPIETDEQGAWLAIAGANAWGEDKVDLQERVNWVEQNHDMILSIAKDPQTDLRWKDAGEPFQFLRFCFEWADFWEQGMGFVSHMVVPVDATCSGLQHYSAMLRDEVGGRSVNLMPGLPRQDIYQDVADRVIEMLVNENQPEGSKLIQFGINRKTTKRQVMVVPYAGTFSSCMDYTRSAVEDRISEGYPCPWNSDDSEEHRQHIVLLAQRIWTAIDETVIKAKQAMKWLSECARVYTKWVNTQEGPAYNKRMTWVCPDGFEAIHYRPDSAKGRVETHLDGRMVLTYYAEKDSLSGKDMALAVAPNFVHSMDACHLRMSIMRGLGKGLAHFGMIHDSFGVHAADMESFLSECVKPSFVEMYQGNVLKDFSMRLPEEVRSNVSEVPEMGDLDLDQIHQSQFFFS